MRLKDKSKIKKIVSNIVIVMAMLAIMLAVLLLPFIINNLYKLEPPMPLFDVGYKYAYTGYSTGELLTYYGSVLTFLLQ